MLGASLLITALTLAAGALSFVNQAVLAHYFGARGDVDAYLVAMSAPMLVSGTISAAFSYSLVPNLIQHRGDQATYGRRLGGFALVIGTIACALALGGAATASLTVLLAGPGLSSPHLAAIPRICMVFWAAAGLALVVGFLSAAHVASHRMILPSVAALAPALGGTLMIVLLGRRLGVISAAWGMLLGYLGSTAVLLPQVWREITLRGAIAHDARPALGYAMRLPLVAVAMLCFTMFQIIDAYWATQVGPGQLAYLGYAQRILVGAGSLVIAGPSVVLVPRLAEAWRDGRHDDFREDVLRAVRMVLAFGAFLTVVLSMLAVPMVRVMLQRGAFGPQDTLALARLLPPMLAGMVAMLPVIILFRALYAQMALRKACVLGLVVPLGYAAFSGLFVPVLQTRGIALAYALVWWGTMIGAIVAVTGRVGLRSLLNGRFAGRLLASLAATGAGIIGSAKLLAINAATESTSSTLFKMVFTGLIAVAIFSGLTTRSLLRIEEVHHIQDYFVRRLLGRLSRG